MEWRQIDGYHYSVSDAGQVRNDNSGRILKPFPCGYDNSYLGVKFYSSGGKRKNFKVHRLVAEAFLDHQRPEHEPKRREVNTVDHLDCDPHNNHYSNLEWCTGAENTRRRHDRERFDRFMNAHLDIEGELDEASC